MQLLVGNMSFTIPSRYKEVVRAEVEKAQRMAKSLGGGLAAKHILADSKVIASILKKEKLL